MQLLLVFLAVAIVSGVRSARHDRPTSPWPFVILSLVVAIGYLSQRVI